MASQAAHVRMRDRAAAALLALVALLSSCGGGTEPEDRGFYRATISGSVNETAEGPAAFAVVANDWTLVLLPPELANGWDFFLGGSGPRPPAGAVLTIRPRDPATPPAPGEATADVSRTQGDLFDFWIAVSGEIRITVSSESRLAGTFELTAQSHLFDGPGPITVTGTFDAILLGDRPGIRVQP